MPVVFADFISVAISVLRYSPDGRSIRPPWRKISTGGGSGTTQPRTDKWSLTSLREKLVKIGAKFVAHGRYMTFQMAEVAVPRDLFRRILQMIHGLRPRRMARC